MRNVIHQQMTKRLSALVEAIGEKCDAEGLVDCVSYISKAYHLTQEQMISWMRYMHTMGVNSYNYSKGEKILVMSGK